MGRPHDQITPELQAWIERQRLFFVSTAPLAAEGRINCSPKGLDTLRILDPRTIAYLDLTGSGIETVAHLRENGRIVLMFCAFEGPPKIVRLHGRGTVLTDSDSGFEDLRARFGEMPGVRSGSGSACCESASPVALASRGTSSPANRDQLARWAAAKGEAGLAEYRATKNATSVDGLPGLKPPRV